MDRVKRFLPVLAAMLLATSCTVLPEAPPSVDEASQAPADRGILAEVATRFAPTLAEGESAFHLMPRGMDAMAWRLRLIDSARQSLDAQYYVWHDDLAGSLLIKHMLDAADRGVKVRLLVDDMDLATAGTTRGNDAVLAALDYHPNLQLRMFNPGKYRDGTAGALYTLGTRFSSYNRRMHNKLLVADNRFAIVGGRNVGDEYYGLSDEHNFIDVDALVAGAIVPETSAGFDLFWNSSLAFPAEAFAPAGQVEHDAYREANRDFLTQQNERTAVFVPMLEDTEQAIRALPRSMHRGNAIFLEKQPEANAEDNRSLYDRLNELTGTIEQELLSTTPYLLPVEGFMDMVKADTDAGVRIAYTTNSLASNNQPTVHAHYKKHRDEILDAGAELYEIHHSPAGKLNRYFDTAPAKAETVTLHMKSAVVDGKRCFIGTLNLDFRSVDINTEDVMYIESEGLCTELRNYIAEIMQPENSWHVTRSPKGELLWTSHEGTVDQQPSQTFSQRINDFFLGLMPIEKQL